MNCKHCARVEAAKALTGPTVQELAAATGMTPEGARGFARQHGIAVRRMPPGRTAKPKVPKVRIVRPNPTREKLNALLRQNPNLCMERTLTDIGQEIGVTRERVRQMLPAPPAPRLHLRSEALKAERSRQLAAYIEEHPEAMLTKPYGGMTNKDIAAALGWHPSVLSDIWRECEYPDRSLLTLSGTMTSAEIANWRYHNYPGRKERHAQSAAKYQAKHRDEIRRKTKEAAREIIGARACEHCGKVIPLTRQRKYTATQNGYFSCGSRRCAYALARARREAVMA